MGMIGYYFRAEDDDVEKIRENGTEDYFFEFVNTLDEECTLDIDKTWHILHFIFNGNSWGNSESVFKNCVLGEDIIVQEEFPVSKISPDEVKTISKALQPIDENTLKERFDIEELLANDIYPVMDGEDEEELFDYVSGYFKDWKNFFQKAALENQAVVFYLS